MNHTDHIQARDHHQHNAYEVLQDLIAMETKVRCTVRVEPGHVSIRTSTYADFLLAKAAIRGRTSQPITWSKPE
jgi:hypothetical protein